METNPSRPVEIFAPCSAAFDLTKLILFQPFDLAKWFVIGFAAFLANLAGGGGGGFNYRSKFGNWNWNFRSFSHDTFNTGGEGMPVWAIPLIGFAVIIGIALVVLFTWLGARGKFIFADCIVRNRGAIAEPWREFRREGNSYFLFLLLVMFAVLCVFGIAGLPLWLPFALHGEAPEGFGLFLGIGLLGSVALVTMVAVKLIAGFMIPLMYRRRCGASEAFNASLGLVSSYPGPVILYALFTIVLWVAFGLIACLTTCVTCCITAIPYVGTVILLPFYVFFMAYLLLFVRQFGPECDVWANVPALEPTPSPPTVPPAPLSQPPPPAEPPPAAPPLSE